VNALRRIHAALVPGGLVVDTQPVSARPSVEAFGVELGTLDLGALALSIWCASFVPCMIRGIGDRGESTEVWR
jgi:hypothetical protein